MIAAFPEAPVKKVVLVGLLVIIGCGFAIGQTYKTLYDFGSGGTNDGNFPNAGFVYASGQLYGTTFNGGAYCQYGCGTVFAIDSSRGAVSETVIHSFCTTGNFDTCLDGAYPFAGLVADQAGNLYGTTQAGGQLLCTHQYDTCGTVFELMRSGQTWTEKVLYSFDGQDGERPTSQLTIDTAGNLYGTTVYGGAYHAGVVFEVSPGSGGTWVEQTLHNFGSTDDDGIEPYHSGVTFDSAGNLYGVTSTGGTGACEFDVYVGCGVAFELVPNVDGTWTENIIYKFSEELAFPQSTLVFDKHGNLFGTSYGGNGCYYSCGGAFKLTLQDGTWKGRALIFDYANGAGPTAGLVLADGTAYGTTLYGGEGPGYGNGVVFAIKNDSETVLHVFSGPPDGVNPAFGGSLFLGGGRLYGATTTGGSEGNGTIFEVSP